MPRAIPPDPRSRLTTIQWTFISFLFLFATGSPVCGAANSSNMLIAGRAIAGMGTSGLQNGAMTIIVHSVPLPKRPALLGVLMGCKYPIFSLWVFLGADTRQSASWDS